MTAPAAAQPRQVLLAEGLATITPVAFDGHCAGVLIRTPATQTLMTADQADAFADQLREKAAIARLGAAPTVGAA